MQKYDNQKKHYTSVMFPTDLSSLLHVKVIIGGQ